MTNHICHPVSDNALERKCFTCKWSSKSHSSGDDIKTSLVYVLFLEHHGEYMEEWNARQIKYIQGYPGK